MRLAVVFGTRPEAIKFASICTEWKKVPGLELIVISTGQHKEMLDQVLEVFGIDVDYKLDVMKENQTLPGVFSAIVTSLSELIKDKGIDVLMVQGDTSTAMAGALAAFYNKIPVAHLEAGLRTDDKYSPYPEEIYRRMISVIARYHFAPTKEAQGRLVAEGIKKEDVVVVGNSVIDALFMAKRKIEQDGQDFKAKFDGVINENGCNVLITGHRRENFGDGMLNFCAAIAELAGKYSSYNFIYPVHLNPNVRKPVQEILSGINNVKLLEPQDYLPFIYLMMGAKIVITDSGGIQEEAPALGKPVVVTRNTTERPEGVEAGTSVLVGTDKAKIIEVVSALLENENGLYDKMSKASNPYGDGSTGVSVLDILTKEFNGKIDAKDTK